MTNHVHLVVQANDNVTAIPQLMKRLAGRQTRKNRSIPVFTVNRVFNPVSFTASSLFPDYQLREAEWASSVRRFLEIPLQ